MERYNLLFAGVGGQGVLLASEVISALAMNRGWDVKKSEIHGMAQRGGSVVSHVRISEGEVFSPTIPLGEATHLVSFEELETLRYLDHMDPQGLVIMNLQQVNPMTVLAGTAVYPQNAGELIRERQLRLIEVDGVAIASKAGNAKAVNTVLLGVLSRHLPFAEEEWVDTFKKVVPQKILELNLKAFQMGREVV
jgi:indolepyruvate ferredoxin oxidoreductase beta subunit